MDRAALIELGVLGLLAEESATRERLKERFNHNFGRYQFAGHGLLDPTVERARERGRVDGTGTYSITADGRERLRDLLERPVEDVHDPAHRSHLFLKLGFIHHLPVESQRAELADLEEQFRETVAAWRETATAHDGADTPSHGYRRDLLALRADLLETQLAWVEDLRRSLAEEPRTASNES